MTKEMAADIIAISHRQNLPVLMHANSYQAHQFAAQAGVDIVAHGLWNWGEYENEEKIPRPIQQALDEIVAKKIGFMATTQVMAGLRAMFDPDFLNDPNLQATVPAALIEWYKSEEGRWFARELQKDFDGLEEAIIHRRFDFMVNRCRQVVQYLAQHNAILLLGSDTPSGPTYGNPPGYNGYLELKHLAESGATLRQILQAATVNNAKAFHLENSYGTIQPGKIANLLLLKKNPLETMEAYDAIATVILHGKALPRATLSANLPQEN
jgi:imidazolonepropionase-like amidohydrolase